MIRQRDEFDWSQLHIREDEVESIKFCENSVKKAGSVAEARLRMDPSISSPVAMGKC